MILSHRSKRQSDRGLYHAVSGISCIWSSEMFLRYMVRTHSYVTRRKTVFVRILHWYLPGHRRRSGPVEWICSVKSGRCEASVTVFEGFLCSSGSFKKLSRFVGRGRYNFAYENSCEIAFITEFAFPNQVKSTSTSATFERYRSARYMPVIRMRLRRRNVRSVFSSQKRFQKSCFCFAVIVFCSS